MSKPADRGYVKMDKPDGPSQEEIDAYVSAWDGDITDEDAHRLLMEQQN